MKNSIEAAGANDPSGMRTTKINPRYRPARTRATAPSHVAACTQINTTITNNITHLVSLPSRPPPSANEIKEQLTTRSLRIAGSAFPEALSSAIVAPMALISASTSCSAAMVAVWCVCGGGSTVMQQLKPAVLCCGSNSSPGLVRPLLSASVLFSCFSVRRSACGRK